MCRLQASEQQYKCVQRHLLLPVLVVHLLRMALGTHQQSAWHQSAKRCCQAHSVFRLGSFVVQCFDSVNSIGYFVIPSATWE